MKVIHDCITLFIFNRLQQGDGMSQFIFKGQMSKHLQVTAKEQLFFYARPLLLNTIPEDSKDK